MPQDKDPNYIEIVARIKAFVKKDEEPSMSFEEAEQVLRDAGYNVDEVKRKMKAIADETKAKSPSNWRKRAQIEQEQALRRYHSQQVSIVKRSRAQTIDAITSLINRFNLNVVPAHRNLLALTDEDLESMLQQLEFIIDQNESSGNEE